MEVKWGLKILDLKTVPEICKEFPISETCLYGLIHKKKVPFWECGRKYLLNLPDVISALHVPVATNGETVEPEAARPESIEEHFDDPEAVDPEDEEHDMEQPEIDLEDDEVFPDDMELDLPEDRVIPDDDLNQEEIENNVRLASTEVLSVESVEQAKEFLAHAPEQLTWILDGEGNLTL